MYNFAPSLAAFISNRHAIAPASVIAVVVADPDLGKRVMQVNLKNYKKDTEFSYEPFLGILGTGLVTSEGETWREQRQRISSALRVEILDDIIAIATRRRRSRVLASRRTRTAPNAPARL